jgi:WD40 repeat protein
MRAAASERRSNASRLFGYDIFVSFALGPPPRGSRSYASDLARRLRERDFTVFFSEEEAPVGDQLDLTLRRALHRSRILVVIANGGTLADPRWVRTEVEEFRRKHPQRPIIPVNIGGALQDPALAAAAEPWLHFTGKIWIDESQGAGDEGIVSDTVLDRLVTAPNAMRSRTRWRWTVRAAFAVLSIVTASALWFAWSDRQNAQRASAAAEEARNNAETAQRNADTARANEEQARKNERRALSAEDQAQQEAEAARKAERIAQSGRLAAESQLARAFDSRLALLLATEAWKLEPTMESRRALYEALHEPVPLRLAAGLGEVHHVAYSGDGRLIAASGKEPLIHLWDVETRRAAPPLRTLSPLKQIAFNPDGRALASIDQDGRVQLWDPRSGAVHLMSREVVKTASAVDWSPDGKLLAIAGTGPDDAKRIVLWDPASRFPVGEPLLSDVHSSSDAISFSENSELLAAAVGDEIQVWDVAKRQPHVKPIPVSTTLVRFMGSNRVAFGGPGTDVSLWRLGENQRTSAYPGQLNWLSAFARPPDARIAATADARKIRLWLGEYGELLRVLPEAHDWQITDLAFSADGTRLASAGTDGRVIEWLLNTETHRLHRSSPFDDRPFMLTALAGVDVTLSDDGQWMVLRHETTRLEWYDVPSARVVASVEKSSAWEGLAVARDGTLAVRTGDRISIREPGKTHPRCGMDQSANLAVFSPDGRLLATWGWRQDADPTVRLWSASDCRQLAAIVRRGEDDANGPVAFSADGTALLLKHTNVIRRWNIAALRFDGKAIDAPGALQIASDSRGRFVATTHEDGIVRLIRLDGNAPPVTLQGPHRFAPVRHVAFSPDGLWFASGADDGRVVLWDLSAGQPAGSPIEGGEDQVAFVAFPGDGRTLVTRNGYGQLRMWDVDPVVWTAKACNLAQRNLSCAEWQRAFGVAPYRKSCPAFPLPDDAARCATAPAARSAPPGTN